MEKVYFTLNYGVDYLTPSTMKRSILPLNFPKPVKLPQAVFRRRFCYSIGCLATVTSVLPFSFLFISTESLKNHSKSQKNHSKSQKNHKMKNPILMDST
jgi:hypothetical protein